MFSQKLCVLSKKTLSTVAIRVKPRLWKIRYCHSRPAYAEHIESVIGNREMVGFGINGQPFYTDHPAFPFPSIRYKEQSPELMALREKEKGDWRLLTLKEKKELYRASYCHTFAEFQHTGNDWMYIAGFVLINISIGIWLYIWFHAFVYTEYPVSFNAANKKAQLQRMINLHVNPITGLASKWDYEKNDWKKKGWFTPKNPFEEEYEEEEEEQLLGGSQGSISAEMDNIQDSRR